jgi:hypothetical protein
MISLQAHLNTANAYATSEQYHLSVVSSTVLSQGQSELVTAGRSSTLIDHLLDTATLPQLRKIPRSAPRCPEQTARSLEML